jgi:aldehyde dehydrogenase (NAD+)
MPLNPPRSSRKSFEPVVVINTFKTEDEAITNANDSEYGLYTSVFTQDINKAIRVVKVLESGSVRLVNCPSPFIASRFPFGGYKTSGVGREGGSCSTKTFSEIETVIIKVADYAASQIAQ